ncbi:MAG: hypothetical protein SGJ01_02870 [Gemmatimonadota bacterium]|nr:hypothetical protein [Gemmatimonadota bacterium]
MSVRYRLASLTSRLLLLAACAAAPATLNAQSSIFGVRGLGLPGRPLTAATRGTGGAFGLFDGESDLNPAAMAALENVTASFALAPSWRKWEGPAGSANLRETRFPLVFVGGPIPGSKVGIGISIGSYADRDFSLTTSDTIALRGVPVGISDTFNSRGGLNEIRLAAGVALGARTTIGGGVYWITGSSRVDSRRAFSDSSYLSIRQTGELSYQGFGLSAGILHQLSPSIQLAGLIRTDGKATVDRDSARAYTVDLPWTIGAGVRLRASKRLSMAGQAVYRTWSGANSDLVAQGGLGARNTLELNVGGEFTRKLRAPYKLPIRWGARYAQLPFSLLPGERAKEFSLSAGTGMRFAQARAAIDLSLEQAWRSEGSLYKERALTLNFGLSIRPYGAGVR